MNGIKLTGTKEIARRLKKMDADMRKKHVDPSLRKGAKVVVDEVKAQAPVVTGRLQASIIARKDRKGSTRGSTMYKIGVMKRAWYFRLVEYGAGPHEITSKKKIMSAKSFTNSRGGIFGTRVSHPGTPKKPFFRPAWAAKQRPAIDTVLKTLRKKMKLK